MAWALLLRVIIFGSILLSGFSLPNPETNSKCLSIYYDYKSSSRLIKSIGLSRRAYPPPPARRPPTITVGIESIRPSGLPNLIPETFPINSPLQELTLSSPNMGVSTYIITIFEGGVIAIPLEFLNAKLNGWGAQFCLAGWKQLQNVYQERISLKKIVIDIPPETSAEWEELANTEAVRSTSKEDGKWLVLWKENDLTRAI